MIETKNEAGRGSGSEMAARLISICIPTCNRPALLEQAIDRCHAQAYGEFEIVIADDGTPRPQAIERLNHAYLRVPEHAGEPVALLRVLLSRHYPMDDRLRARRFYRLLLAGRSTFALRAPYGS
ncbi:glycosyltransferase [Paraburkholderia domus]|uniref:glycosyltransferase n=1 Tax=Paraburkholderia domus TaxID=2793075 RepID=UPI001B1D85C3|nr:glycosyltransferase [Paraburkholderia domus]CAE6707653.1 hypothetical protein R75483_01131 [Paraburkholderia domus]